uniref:Uncharacterized protein n=1 Tax=Nelumbo nucifera TaxID=4432 RepID=A0A822ZTJ8_NELNU|nr:TPA_asm: hypothetical protein HUJ06_016622 [Nelumbo nucifera]
MDTIEDADRCIKHLNQSVLEGRYITVEKVNLFVPSVREVISSDEFLLVLTWRFLVDYIQKTLRQLYWQQSKMMSSSIST